MREKQSRVSESKYLAYGQDKESKNHTMFKGLKTVVTLTCAIRD